MAVVVLGLATVNPVAAQPPPASEAQRAAMERAISEVFGLGSHWNPGGFILQSEPHPTGAWGESAFSVTATHQPDPAIRRSAIESTERAACGNFEHVRDDIDLATGARVWVCTAGQPFGSGRNPIDTRGTSMFECGDIVLVVKHLRVDTVAGDSLPDYASKEAAMVAEEHGTLVAKTQQLARVAVDLGLCEENRAAPSAPLAGTFGVDLACQTDFDEPGRVECVATASGAGPDAQIVFAWELDGAAQAETGAALELAGVGGGLHTVQVAAQDLVSGLQAPTRSVSFSKAFPGAGLADRDRPNGDDIPWVPIIVATGLLGSAAVGAAGVGLARRRRRRGIDPVPVPPSALAALPPPPAPEIAAPAVPRAEPSRPPPAAPPPPVLGAPLPPEPRRRQNEGEIWLEATTTTAVIRGDGVDEKIVTVRALERRGGMTVDASNVVRLAWQVSDGKKLVLVGPSHLAGALRGRLAGSVAYDGAVIVSGVGPRGPLQPLRIEVRVVPVPIEVRVRVSKSGFREQVVEATLAHSCSRVAGRVVGIDPTWEGPAPPQLPASAPREVVDARVTAAARLGAGEWRTVSPVRTAADGSFAFVMPAEVFHSYGIDRTSIDLPATLQLSLDDPTRDLLRWYRVALADFAHELERVPASPLLRGIRHLCDEYSEAVLDQLRHNPEGDYERITSAVNRLRRSLLFALKYRRDFAFQRGFVDDAATEAFSSVFDVVLDFIPLAEMFQGLLAGSKEGIKLLEGVKGLERHVELPAGGFRRILIDVAAAIEELPLIGWIGSSFRGMVWLARKAGDRLAREIQALYTMLFEAAKARGFDTAALVELLRWEPGPRPWSLPQGGALRQAVAELFELLGTLPVLLARVLGLAVYAVLTSLCVGGQLAGKAMGLLPWDSAYQSWRIAVGEQLENWMSKGAENLYRLVGELLGEQLRSPVGPRSPRRAADLVLDVFGSWEDFDAGIAGALERAHDRSHTLRVAEGWADQARKVSRLELAEMRMIASVEEWQQTVEFFSRSLKLVTKCIQAAALCAGSLAEALSWVAGKAVRLLRRPGAAPLVEATGGAALSLASTVERAADVVDAACLRGPILIKELATYGMVFVMGPVRIDSLYGDCDR